MKKFLAACAALFLFATASAQSLPPPVIADPLQLPEPTPQPSTVILYEPVEVVREVVRIVEVPVIVEKTVNVCPVEAKKPARRVIPTPAKVCK